MTERRARPAKPWSRAKAERRVLASPKDEWAEGIVARVLEACHPKQRAFVLDPGRRISAICARGAGKTTAGLARFVIRMVRTRKAKCLFIAQTKDDARELIWEKLQDWVDRFGIEAEFIESRLTCTFKRNGSQLRLVGADDDREVNKLRGKPRHEVGVDETAVFSAKRLANLIQRAIGPRLGDFGGCMWMVSTPGHILQGLYYDATRRGSDAHRRWEERDQPEFANWKRWSSHAWSLLDGAPYVEAIANLWAEALVEKEANQWTDDNPIWRREYLGEWAADDTANVFRYRPHLEDGTPWNRWDPERVGPMQMAKLPLLATGKPRNDWLFAYAHDMGHSDHYAFNIFAFAPTDTSRTIYHVYCFERIGMYARLIAELLLGEKVDTDKPAGAIGVTGWPVGQVADTDGAHIDELKNVYGLQMAKAEKNSDYKFGAIELVNGDLIDGRLKILKDSPLETQLASLQWVANEFGVLKENQSQANHSTDTLVYGRRLIAHLFETGQAAPATTKKAGPAPRRDPDEEPDPDPGDEDFSSLLSEGSYDEGWG